MKNYKVKLPNFEGPLDLLLFLIKKHQIDIYDIPIAFILNEYLKYLSIMEDLDISIEGEYLEILATLIQIKLRSLLPNLIREEEEDPRRTLVNNLLVYKKLKETAGLLQIMAEDNSKYYYPNINKELRKEIENSRISGNIAQDEGNLYDLIKVIQKYLLLEPQMIPQHIMLDEYKIEDKINEILRLLKKHEKIFFSDLTSNCSKLEKITFFLAILELIKRGGIAIFQNKEFSDIHINCIK